MISNKHLESASASGLIFPEFEVDAIGLVPYVGSESILTFAESAEFLSQALETGNVRVILTTSQLAKTTNSNSVLVIPCDEPRILFYNLQNTIAMSNYVQEETYISDLAKVDSAAVISKSGVVIEENAIVEAGSILLSGAVIKAGAIIRAGAIIGSIGFEHKRGINSVLTVEHDGLAIISSGAEIGSGTVVARGFKGRNTVIGTDSRLDGNVYVAHCATIGDRVFVVAGAVILGSAVVEDEVWVGPNTVIRDRTKIGKAAHIGIGSVVLRDVEPGASVLGNPARVMPG